MWLHKVLFIQAFYYFLTALWPLVHMGSFLKVTGEKKDLWLVHTVALLLLCSSLIFMYSAVFRNVSMPLETIMLSILNASVLTIIDCYFVLKKVIRKVYLLDAFIEIIIILGILLSLL